MGGIVQSVTFSDCYAECDNVKCSYASVNMLRVIMQSVIVLSVIFSDCYDECQYPDYHYADSFF